MSLAMRLTVRALRRWRRPYESVEATRRSVDVGDRYPPVPRGLRRACRVETEVVAGRPVVTLTPRASPDGPGLLYLHGGAFVHDLVRPHWGIVGSILRGTGATVTVPMYGLAPEHTVDDALPLLDAVHERAARRSGAGRVVVAGDSAGGNLALVLAQRLRDRGAPSPAALLLFAPWVDATLSNPEIPAIERHDPMLSRPGLLAAARWWAGDRPLEDPLVSPIEDGLHGLPPTVVYQGGLDLLLPDARRYAAKANAAGSPTELRVAPEGFHVFVGAPWTPEARRALRHAAATIRAAAGPVDAGGRPVAG